METTKKTTPLSGGQKLILMALIGAIAIMFLGSFAYRMKGTGLVVQIQPEQGGMGEGMGGKGGPMGMSGVDMEQLRELMRKMEENPNDPKVLVELANTFMMMQAWDKSLEFLTLAEKAAPGDADVHRAMGMVRFERKEYELAQKSFDIVLKKDPNDVLAHYNMGILLKHYMKKPAEGDAHFRRVVQLNPQDPDVLKSAQEELAALPAK
ncbi:tetratricopeptide repeat protein [Humidesulfovibrio sp.]